MTTTVASSRSATLSGELARGAVGGIGAGAVFLVMNMWFATSMDQPARMPILMMSTIVKGDGAMMDGSASVGVGLVVHFVLSMLFGLVFALLARLLRTNGSLALAGSAYGALLYLVNFKVLSPILFTTFEDANQPFELAAHLLFGLLVSFAFFSTGSRRGEPVLSLA